MMSIYIPVLLLVLLVLYMIYYHAEDNKDEGNYACTYIHVFEYNTKDNIPLVKDRFDAAFNLFYNHFILENVYNDQSINRSIATHKTESMSYIKYASLFIRGLDHLLQNHMIKLKPNVKENLNKLISKQLKEFAKNAETLRDGRMYISSDRDFLEYKMKIQFLMLQIVKETFYSQKELVDALKSSLGVNRILTLMDCSCGTIKKNSYTDVYFCLLKKKQERKSRLLYELVDREKKIPKIAYSHRILDFTSIYLDKLAHIIEGVKDLEDLKQKKVMDDYQKEVFDIIGDSIGFSLEAMSEIKHCKSERITIVFDIFLILEIAIARNCPDKAYELISASLREIVNGIFMIVDNKKEEHERFILEVLNIKDLMKTKFYSHVNIQLMFEKLGQHIQRNSSADPDMLAELKMLKNFDKPSRWYFDGSLFDSLVNSEDNVSASKEIYRLVAIYNENSKRIINTCSKCKGKNDGFCEHCAELINHFQQVCLLSRYYRRLLECKTRIYYYQNMEDLIKYGIEDNELALQDQHGAELSNTVQSPSTANLTCHRLKANGVVVESEDCFTHRQCCKTQSKRNKKCKRSYAKEVEQSRE